MSLSDIGIILGICSPLVIGAGTAGQYWAKNEFITVGSFEQALTESETRAIKRLIRDLEYKQQQGMITEREQWQLEGLYSELEELEQ